MMCADAFFKMKLFADIWNFRYALRNLLLKDFRIRYRNMSLGMLWSILNPLVMLGILMALFTFIYPQRGIPNFPIFILIGLTCYNMMSLSIPAATACIMENAAIVKKVAFPRYILPLSVVLSQSFHTLIQLGLVFVFMAAQGIGPNWHWLWLPVILLVELLFIMGAGLMASALFVYFRDVRYLAEYGLTILFWLSPVFYPLTAVTEHSRWWVGLLYQFNPLAGCIDGVRRALLLGTHPDPLAFGLAAGVAAATFIGGLLVFRKMEATFADLI